MRIETKTEMRDDKSRKVMRVPNIVCVTRDICVSHVISGNNGTFGGEGFHLFGESLTTVGIYIDNDIASHACKLETMI